MSSHDIRTKESRMRLDLESQIFVFFEIVVKIYIILISSKCLNFKRCCPHAEYLEYCARLSRAISQAVDLL